MSNILKFLPKDVERYIYSFLEETPYDVLLKDALIAGRVKQIENGLNDKKIYIDSTDDKIVFKNDRDNSSVYNYNIPRAIPFFYTNELRIFTNNYSLLTQIEQSKKIYPFTFTKRHLELVKTAMDIIKKIYEPTPKADQYGQPSITIDTATNHIGNYIEYTELYGNSKESAGNIIVFISLILSGYICCNTKIKTTPYYGLTRYLCEFKFNAKLKDEYINGKNDDLYTHRRIQQMNERIKSFVYYADKTTELIFRKLTPNQYERIKNYTKFELIYFISITAEQRDDFLNNTEYSITTFLLDLNYTTDQIIDMYRLTGDTFDLID